MGTPHERGAQETREWVERANAWLTLATQLSTRLEREVDSQKAMLDYWRARAFRAEAQLDGRDEITREDREDREAARSLEQRIESGHVVDGMSLRAIYKKEWSGLDSIEKVRRATEWLAVAGRVRVQTKTPGPKAGRPSTVIRIRSPLEEPAT